MSRPDHVVNMPAWNDFVARYAVGDVLDGVVVSVAPFGAFVRVAGVDGLAPLTRWPALPAEGATVPVRVDAIDADNHRFSVSPA